MNNALQPKKPLLLGEFLKLFSILNFLQSDFTAWMKKQLESQNTKGINVKSAVSI
jgi:hypothetical protein